MDKKIAQEILQSKIAELRGLSYDALCQIVGSHSSEPRCGSDGQIYDVDTTVAWDGRPRDNIRVIVSVDDGAPGIRRLPTDTFIKAPDESFVGE